MTRGPSRRDFLQQGSLLVAASGLGLKTAWAQVSSYVTADTRFGRIRGIDVGGIKTFKGVPYGGTTSGPNRFLPPTDPAAWTGTRDALAFGPSAPQRDPSAAPRAGSPFAVAAADLPRESEDCLVLNVWTPAVGDGVRRPVMLWCHGGGFSSGSGSSPVTDGTNLARRGDVVVVSINHRLNVLGFTFLEELGGADFAGSGDAGMLDIVHALGWVHDNIAEFGGDPGNVTVFGQSGGGRKVATLLTMPSATGLFHRAIIQSGATLQLVEREQATRVATELMRKLGVERSQVRALQALPIERIMSAYFAVVRELNVDPMTMGFSPAVDGRIVPRHPFHPDASAVSADVPVMLGATRTELTTSADAEAFSLSEGGLRERIGELLGDRAPQAIEVYARANPGATPSDLYFLISSDHRYGAPVMKIAERRAALERGPVYLYYFRWESPFDGGRLRSPHTIEIPFAFDNLDASPLTADAPTAPALADKVSDAWIAFARTGDPSTPKLPAWRAFDAVTRATMVFDDASAVVDDPIGNARVVMFNTLYPS
jgi:para-nitrobenzyl esterase